MAVEIRAGETFEMGTESALFQAPLRSLGVTTGVFRYDVSRDGKRFLIISPIDGASPSSDTDSTPITAIVNWTAALRKN